MENDPTTDAMNQLQQIIDALQRLRVIPAVDGRKLSIAITNAEQAKLWLISACE